MKMKKQAVNGDMSSRGNSKVISIFIKTAPLLLVLTFSACALNKQDPSQAMQAAQFAIDNADQNRLSGYALPELSQARDKLTAARAAEHKKNMKLAKYLADESKISAELASAKTAYIKADQINKDMIKSIDVLKQEMQRNKGELK
ncbi:hypothetical protein tinsulaeT_28050 [Thalassotalea insulae]|uniref:DUF4398 domain-containing protein n=1 Tax=Thalassotalea insulae TaxID=2056778 RepID=A0ABQ6GY78_9GAMM|nr:DUF4398 domain-containing protein [Thalassotalea insulae]GLX79465.1 hypothetical protein tinsulaeT_28050 [Thalassotalea insulae]